MKERLINHVESIFEEAPHTKAAQELKEELLSNSLSKYDDLIEGGEVYVNAEIMRDGRKVQGGVGGAPYGNRATAGPRR